MSTRAGSSDLPTLMASFVEPADEVLLDVFSQGVLEALVPCSRSKLEMPLLFDLTTWPGDSAVAAVSSINKFRYNFFKQWHVNDIEDDSGQPYSADTYQQWVNGTDAHGAGRRVCPGVPMTEDGDY